MSPLGFKARVCTLICTWQRHMLHIPQDSPLVQQMTNFWWPAWQLSHSLPWTCKQALMGSNLRSIMTLLPHRFETRHMLYQLLARLNHKKFYLSRQSVLSPNTFASVRKHSSLWPSSGRSRIFLEGGMPTPKVGVLTYYFANFLPKTAWKWKNLDPEGVSPWHPPWIHQCQAYVLHDEIHYLKAQRRNRLLQV